MDLLGLDTLGGLLALQSLRLNAGSLQLALLELDARALVELLLLAHEVERLDKLLASLDNVLALENTALLFGQLLKNGLQGGALLLLLLNATLGVHDGNRLAQALR